MVRYGRTLCLCLMAVVGLGLASHGAAAQNVAIIPHASTLGLGGDIAVGISRTVNIRLGGSYMKYNFSTTKSGNPYNFHLNLANGQGMIDWFPFVDSFHISAGVVVNDNYVDIVAKQANSYNFNGVTYTAAETGILTGHFDVNQAAPFLGFGFGNPVYGSKRLGFTFDAGVIYQGKPSVTLSSVGGLFSNDPTFQADLAAEAARMENHLNIYRFYPVVQFGLSLKF